MLQSTNEPTESRRLKDASFMKRFRKCLMKVSSNPLKVLGHHPLCSCHVLFFHGSRSGYWQIEIDEADREKTGIYYPEGLYEFKKSCRFGLCNAPATFERMMDNLLRHFKWTMCLCYLDDIIVFSETFEDHLIRLRLVLKCLQEAGLKLNSKKCLFAAQEVKILGHLVSSNGVRPDPDKIKASLLKSGVEFHWGPEEVEAFNSLKKALTSDPVLGMYDEKSFYRNPY
ncbi:retrovirus-related Pol polyprotein from transposon 17.6 [Trichonephila clavipes]|nr:retrovirus-related Pol polyprotein from transposon 17.6 [Trichonephila clavipes]